MTLHEKTIEIRRRLETKFPADEAVAMVRVIFGHLLDYSPVDIVLNPDRNLTDYTSSKADAIVGRILAGEPLQYVIGEARFHGHGFKVTPEVLIPRPETEELVDIIVDEWSDKSDLRVLDVATGSGCIAVSLARALKFAEIDAIDVSPTALEVAKANAAALKAKVNFRRGDILALTPDGDGKEYDIIVSNPPYVLDSERESMSPTVIDYEPAVALFVPDADPLRFYLPTLLYAAASLRRGGGLYFEINPRTASQLRRAVEDCGFVDIRIECDMARHERFLIARKR
ncbi:MAG: peptide chain release factor N(5)-glutamine methyltransferase [Muribaculaceae bacterium]|nr:peptide chain release factor N(5)-glutamine methyltransferase [Muribaculaceae bacterium]